MRNAHDEQKLREAIAYIHGRIEQQLETYADRFGISPMELAARVGTLLVGAPGNHLPAMHQAARQAHHAVAAVEMVKRTHGRGSQTGARPAASQAAARKVSKPKRNTQKFVAKKEHRAKQRIYAQRFEAKKKGLPLPPLPGKKAA